MTMNDAMKEEYGRCRILVEEKLDSLFSGGCAYGPLLEAMRYSLLAGGKRVRPIICLKFCEAAGGDMADALDAACAVEILHTYSLIHDDLPCMDNDATRRGKPANHIKYGELTATLAGDALQASAFECLLSSNLPPAPVVEIGRLLAYAAGPHGICGGQYLDMLDNRDRPEALYAVHGMKTAALISAAARIGVVAAGGTSGQLAAADEYSREVGFAFQVRDDLLDLTASEEELGKPVGSDRKGGKATFASLMSVGECEALIRKATDNAVAALEGSFDDAAFLVWLAQALAARKH